MYFIRSPKILKKLFPDIIWDSCGQDKRLRISFDDGPSIHTKEILSLLDHFEIKASFFCLGSQVKKFSEQFQMIKDGGHLIGHHGYAHLDGWRTGRDEYLQNLLLSESVYSADYFRPPYGRMTWPQYRLIKSQKLIVMWSIMLGDFDQRISQHEYMSRLRRAGSEDILLLHDNEASYPKNMTLLSSIIANHKNLN